MSARRRLGQLERAHPARCPVCGAGGGGPIMFYMTADEPSSPFFGMARPETLPCPVCGAEPVVFTIAIAYQSEEDADIASSPP